eukprot:CAMPEP_0117858032 /NCGR_PEP_ID=MMETSP0950-20121206/2251_1 /TAXON_ID=44440 /ORGANISM="Chattonella subsalsa, Strain CCMP2191" /LENGTH=775 /DNA_ID=CAMNT_0005707547 /DNA_START=620 /DNA_END=2947 /DNA_ORIENTATION=+
MIMDRRSKREKSKKLKVKCSKFLSKYARHVSMKQRGRLKSGNIKLGKSYINSQSEWEVNSTVSEPCTSTLKGELSDEAALFKDYLSKLKKLKDERALLVSFGLWEELEELECTIEELKSMFSKFQRQKKPKPMAYHRRRNSMEQEFEESRLHLQQCAESELTELRKQLDEEEKLLVNFHQAEMSKLLWKSDQTLVEGMYSTIEQEQAYTTYANSLKKQGRDAEAEQILRRLENNHGFGSVNADDLSPRCAKGRLIARQKTELKAVQCYAKNRIKNLEKIHTEAMKKLEKSQEKELRKLHMLFQNDSSHESLIESNCWRKTRQKRHDQTFTRHVSGMGDPKPLLVPLSKIVHSQDFSPNGRTRSSRKESKSSISSLSDGLDDLEDMPSIFSEKTEALEKELQSARDEISLLRLQLQKKRQTPEKDNCSSARNDNIDDRSEIAKMLFQTRKELQSLKSEKERDAGWHYRSISQKDMEIQRLRQQLLDFQQQTPDKADKDFSSRSSSQVKQDQESFTLSPSELKDACDTAIGAPPCQGCLQGCDECIPKWVKMRWNDVQREPHTDSNECLGQCSRTWPLATSIPAGSDPLYPRAQRPWDPPLKVHVIDLSARRGKSSGKPLLIDPPATNAPFCHPHKLVSNCTVEESTKDEDVVDRLVMHLEGPRPSWLQGRQYLDWSGGALRRLSNLPGVPAIVSATESFSDTVLQHLTHTLLRRQEEGPSSRECLDVITQKVHDVVECFDNKVDATKDGCLKTIVGLKDSLKKRIIPDSGALPDDS